LALQRLANVAQDLVRERLVVDRAREHDGPDERAQRNRRAAACILTAAQEAGVTGWQDYALADDRANELPFRVVSAPPSARVSALLGPLGNPGITAYLGLQDIGRPRPGETLVVSAAAGAVGSIAGQIGKARGARVVGIAGSEPKCRHVVEDLGLDACIDDKDTNWRERFDAATPDGVDVDFENVGGPVMDHVLSRLNVGARVVLCGPMSEYDAAKPHVDASLILVRRALMQSSLVLDHADLLPGGDRLSRRPGARRQAQAPRDRRRGPRTRPRRPQPDVRGSEPRKAARQGRRPVA
jgi:threonine dehydrogenase-like Zn-dependent dehydrogenase